MGLEAATYINDLVITNPVGATDPKSQGDDHIRLLKEVLKNTFPSVNYKMAGKAADIASADPLVLGVDGVYFDVTGSTNFASITVTAGRFFVLQFDGALTITHGVGITCPKAENLTIAAGDQILCFATAANTVFILLHLPASGNIKFPSNQSASSNANTLDDYEEGTWTPTIAFAVPGNSNIVYSTQIGRYIKVGQLVVVTFDIQTSTFTHTTASGGLTLSGLPFTILNVSANYPISSLGFQGITKANYTQFYCLGNPNTSDAQLRSSGSGQNDTQVTAADMPTGGSVILWGTLAYRSDS